MPRPQRAQQWQRRRQLNGLSAGGEYASTDQHRAVERAVAGVCLRSRSIDSAAVACASVSVHAQPVTGSALPLSADVQCFFSRGGYQVRCLAWQPAWAQAYLPLPSLATWRLRPTVVCWLASTVSTPARPNDHSPGDGKPRSVHGIKKTDALVRFLYQL
jgi:hypothetical protein